MQELDRRLPLADPAGGARPAQEQSPPLPPTGFQTGSRRERDGLLDRLSLVRGGLGSRQPGVDQNGQVLLVFLLELLDHQLAALGRCAPVDPSGAVTGPVIAQTVVFLLL